MSTVYRNRATINQRGGSIDIDNTTESEKVKFSHRSGSNISMTNVTNVELATNNKQVKVVHDSFETVNNDKLTFVGGEKVDRVGKTNYNLKGFNNAVEIEAFKEWKDLFEEVAKLNSEFKIKRGGVGYPNGNSTTLGGSRSGNPTLKNTPITVENVTPNYLHTAVRTYERDDVTTYDNVGGYDINIASPKGISTNDVEEGGGLVSGSEAPGIIEFGANDSSSTEEGNWSKNSVDIGEKIKDIQPKLLEAESKMGEGGDEIEFVKKNKIEQVGSIFNDYPSIRVDPNGRSQPLEMVVSTTGTFKNHDYVPIVEEVDNSSSFPCGNDDKVVCNRYSRSVGSGGIQLKTTGNTELGGATFKGGFKSINLNASHGFQIACESFVEIQSLKTITLRTNRQVYIESSLGVKGNVIIGGGLSVEGEIFCHHITAPMEIQQTENTTVLGKFAVDNDRALIIGEAYIDGQFYPVYALSKNDLIVTYPHSHHFHNLPLRLTRSNKDVRALAVEDAINKPNIVAQALPLVHSRKLTTSPR